MNRNTLFWFVFLSLGLTVLIMLEFNPIPDLAQADPPSQPRVEQLDSTSQVCTIAIDKSSPLVPLLNSLAQKSADVVNLYQTESSQEAWDLLYRNQAHIVITTEANFALEQSSNPQLLSYLTSLGWSSQLILATYNKKIGTLAVKKGDGSGTYAYTNLSYNYQPKAEVWAYNSEQEVASWKERGLIDAQTFSSKPFGSPGSFSAITVPTPIVWCAVAQREMNPTIFDHALSFFESFHQLRNQFTQSPDFILDSISRTTGIERHLIQQQLEHLHLDSVPNDISVEQRLSQYASDWQWIEHSKSLKPPEKWDIYSP